MLVFSTVDAGKTHIALDHKYAGSVDSANNFFTKFFAWLGTLLHLTHYEKITLNNKVRWFNKKSYEAFLTRLNLDSTSPKRSLFNEIARKVDLQQDLGTMRQHLRSSKVEKLTRKLIFSITHNTMLAAKYVGRGADVNSYFWLKDDAKNPQLSLEEGIGIKRVKFNATYYNPLLYSASVNMGNLHQFMKKTVLDTDSTPQGKKVIFKRRILSSVTDRNKNRGVIVSTAPRRGHLTITPITDVTTINRLKYLDTEITTHATSLNTRNDYTETKLDKPIVKKTPHEEVTVHRTRSQFGDRYL